MLPTLQRMRIAAEVVKGFKSIAFIFKKCTAICSITFSLRIQPSFFLKLACNRIGVSKQKSSIHNAFPVQNRWMRIQYFWIYVPLFGMYVQNFWTEISSPIFSFFFVASPNGWVLWLYMQRLTSEWRPRLWRPTRCLWKEPQSIVRRSYRTAFDRLAR